MTASLSLCYLDVVLKMLKIVTTIEVEIKALRKEVEALRSEVATLDGRMTTENQSNINLQTLPDLPIDSWDALVALNECLGTSNTALVLATIQLYKCPRFYCFYFQVKKFTRYLANSMKKSMAAFLACIITSRLATEITWSGECQGTVLYNSEKKKICMKYQKNIIDTFLGWCL
jgi:hypothetical protein